jgi:flavin-dependent dehydrogenase
MAVAGLSTAACVGSVYWNLLDKAIDARFYLARKGDRNLNLMESCDVLIIGGGPAGSTCARILHQAGLDVVVMDKKLFPRGKVCAGWITPEVVATLQLNVEEYSRTRVFQPIIGFRSGILGGKQVETFYDDVVSYGILRREFDEYLLGRCGARLLLGVEFKTIARDGNRWCINDSINARLVIGAGGHFCPEIEFELSQEQIPHCKVRPEVFELYFCNDLQGYGWCFRKGNVLNVGLGREDSNAVSHQTKQFLRFLKLCNHVPEDTPEKCPGHAYILYGHTQRELFRDGLMLIGDAAGLAYPQSGEGIRPAVESGLLAAETILSAKGNFCRERLAPYADRLIQRFGKPRPAAHPKGLTASLERMFAGTHWFTRRIILDRWFLHRSLPALPGVDPPRTILQTAEA